MQLLCYFMPEKLNYVLLFLAISLIGNVKTATNDTTKLEEQKTVKKDLKVTEVKIIPTQEQVNKTSIVDSKSVVESLGKAVEQQSIQTGSASTFKTTEPQKHHLLPLDEDFLINDSEEDKISETLRTGLFFFVLLSSGAIVFIVFRIYRLRLSRAERKYGVQGDRSNQELTPLPVSIEDVLSDDEDQTVFEIQRQNVRIL